MYNFWFISNIKNEFDQSIAGYHNVCHLFDFITERIILIGTNVSVNFLIMTFKIYRSLLIARYTFGIAIFIDNYYLIFLDILSNSLLPISHEVYEINSKIRQKRVKMTQNRSKKDIYWWHYSFEGLVAVWLCEFKSRFG